MAKVQKPQQQKQQVQREAVGAVRDQYADGEAARAWARFIGDASRRTEHYGAFLRALLAARGARSVLDVACGTGVDSVLLLEAGFRVTSCDASDQMLKHALRTRWQRRREPQFDAWEIEEANWLTLPEDMAPALAAGGRFDAVVCLGNSFAHMPAGPAPDPQADQRRALRNFWECVRPGGVLIVDHRNYDAILATGATPKSCFYYNNSVTDIRTSVVYVEGKPVEVAMDYEVGALDDDDDKADVVSGLVNGGVNGVDDFRSREGSKQPLSRFRLTYYPHRLEGFCALLRDAAGEAARHAVYADFRPAAVGAADDAVALDGEPWTAPAAAAAADGEPAVYVHVLQKPL